MYTDTLIMADEDDMAKLTSQGEEDGPFHVIDPTADVVFAYV